MNCTMRLDADAQTGPEFEILIAFQALEILSHGLEEWRSGKPGFYAGESEAALAEAQTALVTLRKLLAVNPRRTNAPAISPVSLSADR
jgi:hypothetical protein